MFKWNFLHNKKKLKLILPILGIPITVIPIPTTLTSCSVNNNFDGPVKFPNDESNNTIENIKPTDFNNFISIQKSIEIQFETLKNWYESNFIGNENNEQYNFPNFNNYFPKNNLLLIDVCKNKFNKWINENNADILFSAYYNIINLMHCSLGLEWLLNSYVSLGLYEYISKVNTDTNIEAIKWIPIPNKDESYIETLYKIYNSYSSIDKYKFNYWMNKALIDYQAILINSDDFPDGEWEDAVGHIPSFCFQTPQDTASKSLIDLILCFDEKTLEIIKFKILDCLINTHEIKQLEII